MEARSSTEYAVSGDGTDWVYGHVDGYSGGSTGRGYFPSTCAGTAVDMATSQPTASAAAAPAPASPGATGHEHEPKNVARLPSRGGARARMVRGGRAVRGRARGAAGGDCRGSTQSSPSSSLSATQRTQLLTGTTENGAGWFGKRPKQLKVGENLADLM